MSVRGSTSADPLNIVPLFRLRGQGAKQGKGNQVCGRQAACLCRQQAGKVEIAVWPALT